MLLLNSAGLYLEVLLLLFSQPYGLGVLLELMPWHQVNAKILKMCWYLFFHVFENTDSTINAVGTGDAGQ